MRRGRERMERGEKKGENGERREEGREWREERGRERMTVENILTEPLRQPIFTELDRNEHNT